jgi:hypothetical protein
MCGLGQQFVLQVRNDISETQPGAPERMVTLIGNKSDACMFINVHIFAKDFDLDCVRKEIFSPYLSCRLIVTCFCDMPSCSPSRSSL